MISPSVVESSALVLNYHLSWVMVLSIHASLPMLHLLETWMVNLMLLMHVMSLLVVWLLMSDHSLMNVSLTMMTIVLMLSDPVHSVQVSILNWAFDWNLFTLLNLLDPLCLSSSLLLSLLVLLTFILSFVNHISDLAKVVNICISTVKFVILVSTLNHIISLFLLSQLFFGVFLVNFFWLLIVSWVCLLFCLLRIFIFNILRFFDLTSTCLIISIRETILNLLEDIKNDIRNWSS